MPKHGFETSTANTGLFLLKAHLRSSDTNAAPACAISWEEQNG
jgi:hypothetical protein